ncbi:MAG: hypothetical protein AAFP20_18035 [Cyanobacteria bacterium J06614_10]
MRSIEALLQVGEDGKLAIELPEEAAPGKYKVTFVLAKLLGLRNQSKLQANKTDASVELSH